MRQNLSVFLLGALGLAAPCMALPSTPPMGANAADNPAGTSFTVRAETLKLLKADGKANASASASADAALAPNDSGMPVTNANSERSTKPPEIIVTPKGGVLGHWLRTGYLFSLVGERFTSSACLGPISGAGGFAGIGLAYKLSW